jgi:feruloyl-CoA synthase
MRMTRSWGLAETGPAATTTHFDVSRSECLGVPLPGVEVKLVPTGAKTEVRVRGPNVTPGFYRRPDLTAAAFDDEGYLRTGDAVEFADPEDPGQGLVFRGRMAEDFKLSTGTFVSVGTLRPALLSASRGLLQEAVICGQNRDYGSALAWLHPDQAVHCAPNGTLDPSPRAELQAAHRRLAATGGGSSQRVNGCWYGPSPQPRTRARSPTRVTSTRAEFATDAPTRWPAW